MPVPVTIPRLGWSMDEGTFVGWLKEHGAQVRAGEPLFELEGEKALQSIESIDSGILHIAAECPAPGTVASVGTLLGYLLAPGEAAPSAGGGVSPAASSSTSAPSSAPSVPAASSSVASSVARDLGSVVATPRARRAARRAGIELEHLQGSGRNGRIRERDVLAASVESPASSGTPGSGKPDATALPGSFVPLSPQRRTIAQRMQAGGNVAAPVTLHRKVDAANLVSLRKQFQTSSGEAGQPAPSYTDILLKLTAIALQRHPQLNATWVDDGLLQSSAVHLGIAVDTPSGLVVPVVRNVTGLTLREIAARNRQLVDQARNRRLTAAEQADATFTLTNLGMLGVDAFTPIVNLPQVAILGVGRIVREPVVRGEQIVPGETMALSLTIDHRALDGADGARFLADLANGIENPAAWLVG